MPPVEVVITAVGLMTPFGVGRQPFWSGLCAGRSGLSPITRFNAEALPFLALGTMEADLKPYLRPRKSLKVMSRDAQLAVASAVVAWDEAGLATAAIDPERVGVMFGADRVRLDVPEIVDGYEVAVVNGEFDFELWATKGIFQGSPLAFLKNLPNMLPAHISIAIDARGPNNTLHQGEISGLLAIHEAVRVLERGHADVMIAGSASSRLHPLDCLRFALYEEMAGREAGIESACRPFDLNRAGQVRGEAACALVLETRARAEARGAKILARIAGIGAAFRPASQHPEQLPDAIAGAMRQAFQEARLEPSQVGHINANGLGTRSDDAAEAKALHDLCPGVPVIAIKSALGNSGAGCGVVELAASVLALETGLLPPVASFMTADVACPVPVVHGEPLAGRPASAVAVNFTRQGQAAAVVLRGAND